MARAQNSKTSSNGLSAQVTRALREGALYVFGALALILCYALFTYDANDPGPMQETGATAVNNGIGWAGAWVADLLFYIFGRPAYLFTVMVFYFGWMLYREQKTQQMLTRMDYTLRISGFIATLVTSCALATLHFSPGVFKQSAGGVVGEVVGRNLESVMKLLGASTLLFVVWGVSVSVFLGISWFTVMDRIGHGCLAGYERMLYKISQLRDRAEGRRQQAARQDVLENEKKRTAGRKRPHIEPVMPAGTAVRARRGG